jgi:hypothetical protein
MEVALQEKFNMSFYRFTLRKHENVDIQLEHIQF